MARHTDNHWLEVLATGTGTSSSQVQGNVANSAADSGNPIKIGGRYNTTPPTYTDGQRGDLQIGTRGSLAVTLFGPGSVTGIVSLPDNGDATAAASGTNALKVISRNTVFNGTTWDRLYGSATQGAWTSVSATPTVTTVSVSNASSTSVLSANTARKGLILSNAGANNIYVNLAGGTATTSNLLLPPNSSALVLTRWVPTTAITAIAATGATNLSVTELS